MNYFTEIAVSHTVSADPTYCAMPDGKQQHHCKYEQKSSCALFKRALKSSNSWNIKCNDCLRAFRKAEYFRPEGKEG